MTTHLDVVAPTTDAAVSAVVSAGVSWSRRIVVSTLLGFGALTLLPGQLPSSVVLGVAGLGLLAGLPHGAVDHLVAASLTGRSVVLVGAVYAAVALLTWGVLVVVGPVAVVAVVLLSAAHFGLGELEVVRETSDVHLTRPVAAAVAVAGTGALLLPLARSGDLLSEVATSISPGLGSLLGATPTRVGLVAVWVLAAVVAVVAALRAGRPGIVLDVVLVGALGALAPPLMAFAVWFGGWHGVRHCVRLLTVEPRCAALVERGENRRAVLTLARLAAWPTLAAALTLAGLLALSASAPDPTSAVGGSLVLLLALTVPHMVVVRWLDARADAGRESG